MSLWAHKMAVETTMDPNNYGFLYGDNTEQDDSLDAELLQEPNNLSGIGSPESGEAILHVYSELQAIRSHLKEGNRKLAKRESRVAEREKHVMEIEYLLHEAYAALHHYTEEELTLKWQQFQERATQETQKLGEVLKDRGTENKRLKDSFETLQRQNAALKKQLLEIQSKNGSLEAHIGHVQGRLSNLQRLQTLADRDQNTKLRDSRHGGGSHSYGLPAISDTERNPHKSSFGSKSAVKKPLTRPGSVCLPVETVGLLLEWATQREASGQASRHLDSYRKETAAPDHSDRYSRVLTSLSEVLGEIQNSTDVDVYVLRQFLHHIHWCLLEQAMVGLQKAPLSATMRRIGNCMLGLSLCRMGGHSDRAMSSSMASNRGFCQSEDTELRVLACLIALRTVLQADHLAYVFDVLQEDLSRDHAKEVFIQHKGVFTLIPFLKPGKTFCCRAVDLYLILSVDSAVLQPFLASLCCPQWFRQCCELLRAPHGNNTAMLEKLSVVLQRLSKLWASRRLFEVHRVVVAVKELLLKYKSTTNGFLVLNLQSVLTNLDLPL